MAKYELRAIKTAGGDETVRFEALLYCDGVKTAQVSNGGTGGCHDYYFFDREADAAFTAFTTEWWETSDSKREMLAYFEAHPLPGAKLEHSYLEKNDAWVDAEMEAVAFAKRIKRILKTKAVFTLKGDDKGSYRTLNKPCSPAEVQWLAKKYGDKLDVIFDPVSAQPRPAKAMVEAASRAAPVAPAARAVHPASPILNAYNVAKEDLAASRQSNAELLAALKEATRCLAWHQERHGVAMDGKAVEDARALIAKIEGR